MKLRILLTTLGAVVVLGLLAACGSDPTATPRPTATATPLPGEPTATPRPAWEVEWDRLVAGAKEEGELVIDGSRTPTNYWGPIWEEFGKRYDVKITSTGGQIGSASVDRILAERDSNLFLVDISMQGTSTSQRLWEAGAEEEILPNLFLPEVLDLSNWYKGRYWWADPEEKYHLFTTAQPAAPEIHLNTDLVPFDAITSFNDLLDPKYHGLIVSGFVGAEGLAGAVTEYYTHPQMGPEFLRKLILESDIQMVDDHGGQGVDWLLTGKSGIGIFLGSEAATDTKKYKKEGLPVDSIMKGFGAEGWLSTGGGQSGIQLMNRAPHPHAAKLFLNWWLTAEGQLAAQNALIKNDSLRVDIPKFMIRETSRRDPNANYTFPLGQPEINAVREEALTFIRDLTAQWRAGNR